MSWKEIFYHSPTIEKRMGKWQSEERGQIWSTYNKIWSEASIPPPNALLGKDYPECSCVIVPKHYYTHADTALGREFTIIPKTPEYPPVPTLWIWSRVLVTSLLIEEIPMSEITLSYNKLRLRFGKEWTHSGDVTNAAMAPAPAPPAKRSHGKR